MSEQDRMEALGDALRNECFEGVYDVGVVSGDVDTYLEAPVEFPGRLRGRVTIMESVPGTVDVTITTDGTERNTSGETCEATAEAVRKTLEAHEAVLVELVTRRDRFEDVLKMYEPDEDCLFEFEERMLPLERYALVQSDHNGRNWVSVHETPEAASQYIDGEEIPWSTEVLVDLDTGDPFVEHVTRTWLRPGEAPDSSLPWVTSSLLREVAIQHERSLDADAVPDDVKAETVECVTRWWVDQVEGGGSDWDEYGEKFVRMLLDGFQYQLAYEEKYPKLQDAGERA